MTFVVIARRSCAEAIQTLPTIDMIPNFGNTGLEHLRFQLNREAL